MDLTAFVFLKTGVCKGKGELLQQAACLRSSRRQLGKFANVKLTSNLYAGPKVNENCHFVAKACEIAQAAKSNMFKFTKDDMRGCLGRTMDMVDCSFRVPYVHRPF